MADLSPPGPAAAGVDESPTALTAAILAGEDARAAGRAAAEQPTYADGDLIGVGEPEMSLRGAVRSGSAVLLGVLTLITVVDGLNLSILPVLGPNIQSSLHMSNAVLGAVAGASGVLFVLGGVPLAALADRAPRVRLASACTVVFGVITAVTAAVPNPFWLFVARSGAGLAQSNEMPLHGALITDSYPVNTRAQVFGAYSMGRIAGTIVGPVIVGLISVELGWRWAFPIVGLATVALALLLSTRPEPQRGAFEQVEVLGEQLHQGAPPVSIPMAFGRLNLIRTFRYMLLGLGALGFSLFSAPVFVNKLLQDHYHLSAFHRGIVGSLAAVPALVVVPLAAQAYGRRLRTTPPHAVVLCAVLIGAFGAFLTIALYMPSLTPFVVLFALSTTAAQAAFTFIGPLVGAVVPYRLRSQGFAMVGIYIFLMGAFLGSVLTGMISDSLGVRTALTIVVLPSALIGAGLLAGGAFNIRQDMGRVIEELQEESREAGRLAAHTGETPMLQVRNLDFAYETVQVLFDVEMEVYRGEVLALLGTNGAGKSSLLNCICGLGIPSRGVVRLDGHTITYSEPDVRVRAGIVAVQGGRAIWPGLSVGENLRLGAFLLRATPDEMAAKEQQVLQMFPELISMLNRNAATLSGGEQQLLALAKAMLLDPQLLLIDELSLGLSPIATAQMVERVRQLKERGLTIVIVEQSVNVALTIADRAIFMEKGRVRFSGAAGDLLDRDDLLRAVFLGSEGG